MRKYYRLVLLVVSILSLISLLFYRHEYNRLRYVLEVLNFFGKPGEIITSDTNCLLNTSFSLENTSFADSTPVWHRLSNDLFIYSAFWEDYNKNEQVKAIGVGRNPSRLKIGCRLWYENQDLSSEGRVSYSAIPMRIKQSSLDREKAFPYFISCAPEVLLDITPFAVEFFLDGYQEHAVTLPITISDYSQDINNSSVICISPSSRKISPLEATEFIAFHQVLGVSQYLIYDDGLLAPTTSALLKEKKLGFRITTVPWNFPFMAAEASATTLRWDCLYRSASVRPAGVLQLAWHQLIVPRYHLSLAALANDFDAHLATARFLLPSLRFCTEYPQHKSPVAMQAFRLLYHADTKPSEEPEWALERPFLVLQGSRTQQKISRGIIAVHNYVQCVDAASTQPAPYKKYDNSISRFVPFLKESRFLNLWLRHQGP